MLIHKFPAKAWELLFFILLIVLIGIFVIKTLNGGILFWDDGFYPFNPYLDINREISAWNGPIIPGYPFDGAILYLPLIILALILRFFSLGFSIIDSIYIIILLFIGGLGTYLLSKFITLNYIFKDHTRQFNLYFGSVLASFYFVFNYEQMSYYGGEFYQGFLMVNLTPILLYLILLYMSSPVKFGFWNKYLGLISIVSLIIAGGIDISGSMGSGIQWFSTLIIFTILAAGFLENEIVRNSHFVSKAFSILIIIVLSSAWVLPYVYFNIAIVNEYAVSDYVSGRALIVAGGYNTILQNAFALFTSGFGNYPSFIKSGPYRIWYAPLALVNSNLLLIGLTYVPFIFSLLYIFFINQKWVRKKNLLFLLFFEIFFISLLIQLIDTHSLSYSNDPIISGFNFFLQPSWSIYPFVMMISVLMGISLNILQNYLSTLKKKDLQTIFIDKIKKTQNFIPTKSHNFSLLIAHIKSSMRAPKAQAFGSKVIRRPRKGRLQYCSTMATVIILVILFIAPIFINPLETYQYGSEKPIQGVFKVDSSFNEVGTFLSRESPYCNVLYLPVTISPSASMTGNSSYMIVTPPFSFYTGSEMFSQDPGPSNTSLVFPILSNFPNISYRYFSNFLSLLGIKYIVVNTNEYPTWVNQTNFAESGPPWDFKIILNTLNESKGINFVCEIGPYYIYEVENVLPMVYASNAISAKCYGTLTPESIFNEFANGSLLAGKTSIINSTLIHSSLVQYNTSYLIYSSYLPSTVNRYPVYINHLQGVNGKCLNYDQLISIKNYSRYGINTNISNVYFAEKNGSYINAWIQFHNSTRLIVWTKIPLNTSEIYMCVLPQNANILSKYGFTGISNSSYDNIARVFPKYKVNYHFESPFDNSNAMQVLFSNSTSYWNDYYQGFGFTISNMGNMNFSDTPFFQLNSPNDWNPAFEFYSSNDGTGYVYGIQGNTTIPYFALKFGYLYVYNINSSLQNTVQNINGYYNELYSGDNGIFSNQFIVDGSRTINVTFSDAFQFTVPNGGMPNVSVGNVPTIIYPVNSTIIGPINTNINEPNNYLINFNRDGEPVNSSFMESILRNSKIFVVNDTSGLNNTVNGYIDNNSIRLNLNFRYTGEYTLLFESYINNSNIIALKTVQVGDYNKSSIALTLNVNGPQVIVPGMNYTYDIKVEYSNCKPANSSLTDYIFDNLVVNLLGHNNQDSYNKSISINGVIYLNFTNGNSGLIELKAHSWVYSFNPVPTLDFSRVSESEYYVKVNSNSSFYLVLNQAFNKGWVATINKTTVRNHCIANDFANSWYMPPGNYTAVIYFEPQHYQNLAFDVSLSTIVFATTVTIFDFFIYRKFTFKKN